MPDNSKEGSWYVTRNNFEENGDGCSIHFQTLHFNYLSIYFNKKNKLYIYIYIYAYKHKKDDFIALVHYKL